MVIYKNEIKHWGDQTIYGYIKEEQKDVVIYGTGQELESAYGFFEVNNIPIKAIGDIDPSLVGHVCKKHNILSYEEMVDTVDKNDLICVSIGNDTMYRQVRENLMRDGFQRFVRFCTRDGNYFQFNQNFNPKIPTVLVGVTPLSQKIRQRLEKQNISVSCFVEFELEEEGVVDGLPLRSLHHVLQDKIPMNFILGNSMNDYYIKSKIMEENIHALIYRGISVKCDFAVEHYTYENGKIRYFLSKILSNLHFILKRIPQEESKTYLKALVKSALTHMKETSKPILTADEVNELSYIEEDSLLSGEERNTFENVETNPKEFFALLYQLYAYTLIQEKTVSLVQKDEQTQIFME